MKNTTLTFVLSAAISFSLSAGSVAKSNFEWGHYDSALYVYSKHPEKLPEFEQALRTAIERGRASHRLAPGLQAELGYCLMGEGKRAEAAELFKAEMERFPESREFLLNVVGAEMGQ